ncbi:MAG TPA: polysaccharide deacetylase family protein [Hanamia sp.]|nr:polysaccharide deacetylase family protein [Hanamia sp.]
MALCFLVSCTSNTDAKKNEVSSEASARKDSLEKVSTDKVENTTVADAATILARKQVPVLCYHHIRDAKPGQSETFKSYSVSPSQFASQMKALKDSGYETVLPDQLYNYLANGAPLPPKPVMLTFDDTDEEQFSIGYQEMKKYGFKGVFFIMTISINRPRYMTKEQLKQLADEGNAVESHTWDHHMVTKYQGDDWEKQFVKPRKTIEDITGKAATYFAYPFGLWNAPAIPELKKAGFKMAFILSTKRDSTDPLFTVRRMIVPGQWSTPGMLKAMNQTFK